MAYIERHLLRSSVALLVRQVAVLVINMVSTVVLARIFSPEVYGIGAIVAVVQSYVNVFSDFGLGAGAIQSKNNITNSDRTAILALQFIVAIILTLIGTFVSGPIAKAYHLPSSAHWIFALVPCAFVIGAFQTPSTVSLEKELSYTKIALLETLKGLVYASSMILLALSGLGAWTYVMASILSAAVSAILAYRLFPWTLDFNLTRERFLSLWTFGLKFQAAKLISLGKDSFAPLIVPMFLNLYYLGLFKWASTLAVYPVSFLTMLSRLFFPFFSVVQNDRAKLESLVNQLHFLLTVGVCLGTMLLSAFIHPIVILLLGARWSNAIPIVYWLVIGLPFVPGTMVVTAMLNALNKPEVNLRFSLMWMSIEWIIGVPSTYLWGIQGYGLSIFVSSVSNILVYIYALRFVKFTWFKNMYPAVLSGSVTTMLLIKVQAYLPATSVSILGLFVVSGILLYVCLVILFSPVRVFRIVADFNYVTTREETTSSAVPEN